MADAIKEFFANTPPWVGGALMAILISVLRVVYDREETSFIRIMLESLICGALSVSAGSALDAMGYGQNWYLFCGGVLGFMGSQSIRAVAQRALSKKLDG